jgi:hypothetical protein
VTSRSSRPLARWEGPLRAALAVLLAWPLGVVARPRVEAPREVGTVVLTEVKGSLELAVTVEDDSESYSDGTENNTRDIFFEENLRLQTRGYVYHPRFLEFGLGGRFGLVQENFSSNTQSDGSGYDNDSVEDYDVNLLFLKEKDYPLTLFARRYQAIERRTFLRAVTQQVETKGLAWQYRNDIFPIRLRLQRTDTDSQGAHDGQPDSKHRDDNLRLETGWSDTALGDFALSYEYQDVTEETDNVDYTVHRADFSNDFEFGAEDAHRLHSEARYFDQLGPSNYTEAVWRQRLRLQHAENLSSWYGLELGEHTRSSAGSAESKDHYGDLSAGVQHRLFQSLTSTLDGVYRRTHYDADARQDELDLGGALQYRKQNPWGTLTANYGLRWERDQRDSPAGLAAAHREQHTFRDPDPVVLYDVGTDPASIVITKADLTRTYQRDVDYSILEFGGTIEIHRRPAGRIADGETVWVEYAVAQSASATTDTTRQTYGVGQHFRFGLSLYYRGLRQDQSTTPSTAALDDNSRNHLFGARYSPGALQITTEYETEASNTPYDAYRVNAAWSQRFDWGTHIGAAAGWSRTIYQPPDERTIENRTISGTLTQPLNGNLMLQGTTLYRNQQDSVNGDDSGVELELSLRWSLHQITCWLSYEYDCYQDDPRRESASTIRFKLVREF